MFVANRGEIAVRIIRACRDLGIECVLGVSDVDRESLGARLADRTVCIGPAAASRSYLAVPTIVSAALHTGCEAVHPGYGFLAERADFANACVKAGLIFIGPSAEAIESMGDKSRARQLADAMGVPTVPGSAIVRDIEEASRAISHLGFPALLKAVAGGGGRGMRIVNEEGGLAGAFRAATAEAQSAFGDGSLYIERYVARGRHVEIQLLGDQSGRVAHLFERDCSIQRRHQKLVEESPSTAIGAKEQRSMAADAVRLAEAVRYCGAGTVEFIYDLDRRTYHFLEMNTRIQVEHPVTEQVTGIDLVKEQIRVCGGMPISFEPGTLRQVGHAIECRLNAEDPVDNFRPSPGVLDDWQVPVSKGLRVDTHCYAGYRVPPHYDSLLAKVIVHGRSREEAIVRMEETLRQIVVRGVATTLPFHLAVMRDADYRRGDVTTDWVERKFIQRWCMSNTDERRGVGL
jgi:acetyl-CoA carboxylase biotin carboxylase subunit